MNRSELVAAFVDNHQAVVKYISALPADKLHAGANGKWPPLQQLHHIWLTLVPFTKVLASKEFIREKFGTIDRPTWDNGTVIANYLRTSRKAPDIYDPALAPAADVAALNENIEAALQTIQTHLATFTEEDIDTLVLPHPLLGKLTIREMFYLMSYHPLHHLKQIGGS